jgi:hypothetical protein
VRCEPGLLIGTSGRVRVSFVGDLRADDAGVFPPRSAMMLAPDDLRLGLDNRAC